MAIAQHYTLLWSDMSNLFTRISNIRRKFGYSTINPASYGGVGTQARVANVQNMKDLLVAVRGNKYATATVNRFSIPVPGFGTIIYASTMTPIIGLIGALENTCVFDNFAFFGCNGYQSFAFYACNGYQSFAFYACNGFNGFNGNIASCGYFNTSFTFNGKFSCGPYNLSVSYN